MCPFFLVYSSLIIDFLHSLFFWKTLVTLEGAVVFSCLFVGLCPILSFFFSFLFLASKTSMPAGVEIR